MCWRLSNLQQRLTSARNRERDAIKYATRRHVTMLRSHRKTTLEILGRNPIHPFPARIAPGIALEALGKADTGLRVLDPMAGSGTVLAVPRATGHPTTGAGLGSPTGAVAGGTPGSVC